ncbi:MAG: hypothetical protein K8S99_12760 [Planctomycetes bacterium]|nr:hypothetical protein [Planctomycetota bacterium]
MPMDAKLKRSNAEKIRRAFTRRIADLGFTRTKPTFWTRQHQNVIQFIHLHLFSFEPAFRVHFGIYVLNDDFPSPILNGLDSDTTPGPLHKYHLRFHAHEDTIPRCMDDLDKYCREIGEPWFDAWRTDEALLSPGSPLREQARDHLRAALQGKVDLTRIQESCAMLGITYQPL